MTNRHGTYTELGTFTDGELQKGDEGRFICRTPKLIKRNKVYRHESPVNVDRGGLRKGYLWMITDGQKPRRVFFHYSNCCLIVYLRAAPRITTGATTYRYPKWLLKLNKNDNAISSIMIPNL